MLMEVTCRCGWVIRGSRSEVIRGVQAHARSAHGLELTPGEVRAVWKVAAEAPAVGRRNGGGE